MQKLKSYPNADLKRFRAYLGGINFEYQGLAYDVFKGEIGGPIHHYLGEVGKEMTKALGTKENFPPRYTFITPTPYDFYEARIKKTESGRSFAEATTKVKIRVSQKDSFEVIMRDIYAVGSLRFWSRASASDWYDHANLKYWPQQLSLAVWCATTGCGVAMDMLEENIMGFHAAFTVRRILHEMGCALPGDKAFKSHNNPYNVIKTTKILSEFDPRKHDFRNKESRDSGLGYIHRKNDAGVWYTDYNHDYMKRPFRQRFGGDGSLNIGYISSENKSPWNAFVPSKGLGLTNLGRINGSIEAFVYCILGSQANTRSPIVNSAGSSQETQREFVELFESAVIEESISESIQRYQNAVSDAKVKLDYAISPGCWLYQVS